MAKRKGKSDPAEAPADGQSLDELGLLSGSQVRLERIAWEWPGMVVRNALNLFDGSKGTGKSSVMASVAAAICNGKRLPEAKSTGAKGACLWFGSEEHFGGSVVSRWAENGGDRSKLYTVVDTPGHGEGRLILPHQEERLRNMVKATKCRVIVCDPFTALGDAALSTRDDQAIRFYLESLARVAHDCGVTVLLARHLRKGRAGCVLDHGMGSVAIAAVCRSVLRVERDKKNPSVCFMACVSGNYGKAPGVIPYTLQEKDGHVFTAKFGARKDTEIEEVLEGGDEPDERDAIADARALLLGALKDGPVDAKTILEEGKKNGIGERTLRKAKAELKIGSRRISAGRGIAANWKWHLPKGS